MPQQYIIRPSLVPVKDLLYNKINQENLYEIKTKIFINNHPAPVVILLKPKVFFEIFGGFLKTKQ